MPKYLMWLPSTPVYFYDFYLLPAANWGGEITVFPLDSIVFSIITEFLPLLPVIPIPLLPEFLPLLPVHWDCLSANSRICWRCIKGRYCKDVRKTAIAVDKRQYIGWVICVNVTSASITVLSFVKEGILSWECLWPWFCNMKINVSVDILIFFSVS